MKIALLCPTRERPGDVVRLIRSIESTVHDLNNIKLYLGTDPDDETQHELDDCIRFKSYITKITFPRYGDFPGLGVLWNYLASQASEEIFAMVGDDFVYETRDWDQEIIKHFESGPEDNLLLVHCNDGLHGDGNKYTHTYGMKPGQFIAVNPFIHRKYYELNGYYLREEFKHQFVDTWLDCVYHELKRKVYRHDIMIRHLHYTTTGTKDKTTSRLRQNSIYKNAKYIFDRLAPDREQEITRLKNYIENETV